MPIAIEDFWKLASASGLLTPERCQQLQAEFSGLKGAGDVANSGSLAQWLVANGNLTRYQAALLSAGHGGPFVYGSLVIEDGLDHGRLAGLYRTCYQGTSRMLIVPATLVPGDLSVEEFRNWTEAYVALKHAHLLRVHGEVVLGSQVTLGIDDLQGQTLRELLSQRRVRVDEACGIAFQTALGLSALHERNLTHGSITPGNIWIDNAGTAKLLTFPLVPPPAAFEPSLAIRYDFLAPELYSGQREPDVPADIYALGCVLFEMISGRVPFPGGTPAQLAQRHRLEVPPRLDEALQGVPEDLGELVAEMLSKDPILRSSSASQVAHALTQFVDGAKRRPAAPPPPGAPTAEQAWTGQAPAGVDTRPTWAKRQQPAAPPAPKAAGPLRVNPAQFADPPPTPVAPQPVVPTPTPSAPVAARPTAPAERPQPPRTLPADTLRPCDTLGSSPSPPPARPSRPKPVEPVAARPPDKPAAPRALQPPAPAKPAAAASPAAAHLNTDWEPAFVTQKDSAGAKSAAPPRRSANSALIGTGVALSLLLIIVLAGWMLAPQEAPPAPADADTKGNSATDATEPATEAEAAETDAEPDASTTPTGANEIEDDGQTLWASPTAGQPLSLDYLPSGAQVFLVLRPAELLKTSEGQKLADALGPAGEAAARQVQSILGVDFKDIEQLTIAFFPHDAGLPQAAFVMRTTAAIAKGTLPTAWSQPVAAEQDGKPYFQGKQWSYYLPDSEGGRLVAIAPPEVMKQILELEGAALVRKEIEKLLPHTDATRHVNLLVAPRYLITDGQTLMTGELEKLREPLARFWDDSLESALLSAHVTDNLFVELRGQGISSAKAQELAPKLLERWQAVPEQIENYVASLAVRPYGRLVVNRFPRMLQLLAVFTRGGVDERQVLLRSYLPASAAHNLLLGAELTLAEPTGAASLSVVKTAPAAGPTADEALAKTISLSFPRETLQRAIELLSQEIGVPIVILGPDLQAEGITKNQSLKLDERDQPAGAVLEKVLALANPDGKLIYVLQTTDQGPSIAVTTRKAAEKRHDPLPEPFQAKSRP